MGLLCSALERVELYVPDCDGGNSLIWHVEVHPFQQVQALSCKIVSEFSYEDHLISERLETLCAIFNHALVISLDVSKLMLCFSFQFCSF